MYFTKLRKYINLLDSIIDVLFYESNNVNHISNKVINKYCINDYNYSIEKYVDIANSGYSVCFLEDKYKFQLMYFDSGSIIINKDNLMHTYHLSNINDEECKYIIKIIKDIIININNINERNNYSNKHK